jgi:signal transduction histidine kinase
LELIVANYDHRDGGIRTEIVIGNAEHIQKLQTRHAAQELIILGCLIMIGFYHLGLYILRRKEVANVMFALLCLFVGLRMGLIGEGFVVQWIDAMSWEFAIRLEYIAFLMAGWAGFAFFQSMYPLEIKRVWYKLSSSIAAVLILCVLMLKPLSFTSSLVAFQVYILLFSVRVLVGLVQSAHRKREGARLALIGVAGLVLTIVNDMLFYNGWWQSIDLLPFGLLFLIVMNSFIISLRFSLTYERAEQMSIELTEWNNSLEQKIEQRTEELQRSYLTLEEAKIELERMEKSRTQLVSNISHDLRTPITLLQGYLEALRDDVISDPAQRDNTIRLMLSKVEGLNSLIQDLFDLSVLEARRVELSLEDIPLAGWKERLTEQYGMEMESKGIVFSCAVAAEEESLGASVTIDVRRMDRVFANLLYNALRYTPNGGTIRITLSADSEHSYVEVLVEDSGAGIEPGDLPHIFDRFYKKDKSRHSSSGGSGLGLSIAKEIVELHGGLISAYNPPEGGSAFRILLPMTAS